MSQLLPSRIAAAFRVVEEFQRYRVTLSGATSMNELVPTEIDPEVRLPSVNHESLEADAMNLVRGYLNGDIEFHDPIETGYKAPPPAEELAVEE